jgi:hypothetical protein
MTQPKRSCICRHHTRKESDKHAGRPGFSKVIRRRMDCSSLVLTCSFNPRRRGPCSRAATPDVTPQRAAGGGSRDSTRGFGAVTSAQDMEEGDSP